jgi:hypothetical protein
MIVPITAGAISRTSVANFIRYLAKSKPMMPKPIRGAAYAQIVAVEWRSAPASPAVLRDAPPSLGSSRVGDGSVPLTVRSLSQRTALRRVAILSHAHRQRRFSGWFRTA